MPNTDTKAVSGFSSVHFYSGKPVLLFRYTRPGTLPGQFYLKHHRRRYQLIQKMLIKSVQYWTFGPEYIYQRSSSHLKIIQRYLFSYVCAHYSVVFNPLLFFLQFLHFWMWCLLPNPLSGAQTVLWIQGDNWWSSVTDYVRLSGINYCSNPVI